jgi:ParB/RepB/Spo0J family partition protein
MEFDEAALDELAASIREHGVLQPVLVRPVGPARYQLIAGERRWRASKAAGLPTIPALIEEIDDDTALEISIIENLQREDLSPLDEAMIYDRMVRDHGYSIRRLAQKLGKDKGYLENRLRLADAPDEIKQLVSVRKDTLSHAYELLKIQEPRKRRRLAEQVARGELSLVKLRERIEGRPRREVEPTLETVPIGIDEAGPTLDDGAAETGWAPEPSARPLSDDSLLDAKQSLADAIESLTDVLRDPRVVDGIGAIDRQNLAKYLTIAKLRLENAIALVRSGEQDR